MKRRDLIRQLEGIGCELLRHGGKHDWYRNPSTGMCQPIPRHREIKDHLARQILRLMAMPEPDVDPESDSDESIEE